MPHEHPGAEVHLLAEADLAPTLEGTASAVQQARNRPYTMRPATVVGVSPSRETVTVIDDHDSSSASYGVTNIGLPFVKNGDRVMLMHYPPHGTVVIGMARGGYTAWGIASTANPGNPGSLGSGWANAPGVGQLDQDLGALPSWFRTDGIVELRGRLTRVSGSGNVLMWVPEWYRPRNNLIFPVCTAPAYSVAFVEVFRDGRVIALNGTVDSGSNGFITMDGITYTVQ